MPRTLRMARAQALLAEPLKGLGIGGAHRLYEYLLQRRLHDLEPLDGPGAFLHRRPQHLVGSSAVQQLQSHPLAARLRDRHPKWRERRQEAPEIGRVAVTRHVKGKLDKPAARAPLQLV